MEKVALIYFNTILLISFTASGQLGGSIPRYKSDTDILHSILNSVNLDQPNSNCLECDLNEEGLVKKANSLQENVDAFSKKISERLRPYKGRKGAMNNFELAQQAADQVSLLQNEVSRQKILNQIKQLKLNACTQKSEDNTIKPTNK